ncbi:hypothetical protein [Desulfocucumis palustris]|uniref:hypothetical protein n=1 Tax=Desulfocucumis palustris TaxID=1898651 RepID=UPI000CEA30B7|nr:hypothetical protein [Desulfocucumis palustris]
MNNKKIISYMFGFIFMNFIIVSTYIGAYFDAWLFKYSGATYTIYPYSVYKVMYTIIIGLLLGMPGFLGLVRTDGMWSYDWLKLIFYGAPLFYVAISPLVFIIPYLKYPFGLAIFNYSLVQQLSGVILGYLAISLIKKRQRDLE